VTLETHSGGNFVVFSAYMTLWALAILLLPLWPVGTAISVGLALVLVVVRTANTKGFIELPELRKKR